jgi:hypothetical protein
MFMPNSPSPPRGIAKREGLSKVAHVLNFKTYHRITGERSDWQGWVRLFFAAGKYAGDGYEQDRANRGCREAVDESEALDPQL